MIYREFLAVVLFPAIVVVATLAAVRYRGGRGEARTLLRQGLCVIGLLVVAAVGWTTPWDGWLVRTGVWGYPNGSVLASVFDVPVEEYVFMVGQVVLTGLWTLLLARGRPAGELVVRRPLRRGAGWGAVVVAGVLLGLADDHLLYLGSMLAWFGVPLAVQAVVGAEVLRAHRFWRLGGLGMTLPLWVADAAAIGAGAWRISPDHTVGIVLFGLPLEEAVFFFVTNLLIVNSIVLGLVAARRVATRSAGRAYERTPGDGR